MQASAQWTESLRDVLILDLYTCLLTLMKAFTWHVSSWMPCWHEDGCEISFWFSQLYEITANVLQFKNATQTSHYQSFCFSFGCKVWTYKTENHEALVKVLTLASHQCHCSFSCHCSFTMQRCLRLRRCQRQNSTLTVQFLFCFSSWLH